MKVSIIIKNKKVEFKRNWFTGSFTYSVNGFKNNIESIFNYKTHFSTNLSKFYEVKIEEIIINIVKTRPLFFAGLRPHNYKFYIENSLIKEIESL